VIRLIYVAGAFRSNATPYNQWEQVQNIREAEALGLAVWKLGAAAIVPHLLTEHFQGALPDAVWLERDLEIMRRCDGVLLVPNWPTSVGATAEKIEAERVGLPVFETLRELDDWLKWQQVGEPNALAGLVARLSV
jgi:hypothetical protein